MGKKQDGRDDEMEALKHADGVDSAKIAEQIAKNNGEVIEPAKTDPPKEDPPKTDPPKTDPPKSDVPNLETIRAGILNEMFGDQFKTVEDVKKANILEALKELPILRQKNQELDSLIKAKPKHHYANDDIAKMDEFVRATGIKDVNIFNKLNEVADVANMPDMDALILQHIIENPRLARKDPQEVRRYFEMKYNVDPAKVESGDITADELNFNKMELEAQADKAKTKLQELKGKIKMPEIPKEEPPSGKTKWTPEVETKQKADWTPVNAEMAKEFKKIPIFMKGSKEPIINFEVPEETTPRILKNALYYIVSNQLEVNQENVSSVARSMLFEIKDVHFEDIAHAIFERGRTIVEKEYLEKYANPSKEKNSDTPPGKVEELTDEAKRKRAYDMESAR